MYKQILSPVDGSPTSNCGMMEAIRLAKDQNAQLRFLHVVDTYFPLVDSAGELNVVYMTDILRQSGQKILEDAEAAARKEGVVVETKMVEAFGARVAEYIVEHAHQWPADLIVMGTHGFRGVSRMLMGSDAETVVRASPVPVLLVKDTKTT